MQQQQRPHTARTSNSNPPPPPATIFECIHCGLTGTSKLGFGLTECNKNKIKTPVGLGGTYVAKHEVVEKGGHNVVNSNGGGGGAGGGGGPYTARGNKNHSSNHNRHQRIIDGNDESFNVDNNIGNNQEEEQQQQRRRPSDVIPHTYSLDGAPVGTPKNNGDGGGGGGGGGVRVVVDQNEKGNDDNSGERRGVEGWVQTQQGRTNAVSESQRQSSPDATTKQQGGRGRLGTHTPSSSQATPKTSPRAVKEMASASPPQETEKEKNGGGGTNPSPVATQQSASSTKPQQKSVTVKSPAGHHHHQHRVSPSRKFEGLPVPPSPTNDDAPPVVVTRGGGGSVSSAAPLKPALKGSSPHHRKAQQLSPTTKASPADIPTMLEVVLHPSPPQALKEVRSNKEGATAGGDLHEGNNSISFTDLSSKANSLEVSSSNNSRNNDNPLSLNQQEIKEDQQRREEGQQSSSRASSRRSSGHNSITVSTSSKQLSAGFSGGSGRSRDTDHSYTKEQALKYLLSRLRGKTREELLGDALDEKNEEDDDGSSSQGGSSSNKKMEGSTATASPLLSSKNKLHQSGIIGQNDKEKLLEALEVCAQGHHQRKNLNLELLSENPMTAVILVNARNQRIIWVNQYACFLFNRVESDLVGRDCSILMGIVPHRDNATFHKRKFNHYMHTWQKKGAQPESNLVSNRIRHLIVGRKDGMETVNLTAQAVVRPIRTTQNPAVEHTPSSATLAMAKFMSPLENDVTSDTASIITTTTTTTAAARNPPNVPSSMEGSTKKRFGDDDDEYDEAIPPLAFVGYFRDITLLQTLSTAVSSYRFMTGNSSEAIVVADLTGTLVEVNEAAGRLFGFNSHFLVARGSNLKVLMPDYIANVHDGYLSSFRSKFYAPDWDPGTSPILGKYRDLPGKRSDGSEVLIQLRGEVFIDNTRNKRDRLIGYFRDRNAMIKPSEFKQELSRRLFPEPIAKMVTAHKGGEGGGGSNAMETNNLAGGGGGDGDNEIRLVQKYKNIPVIMVNMVDYEQSINMLLPHHDAVYEKFAALYTKSAALAEQYQIQLVKGNTSAGAGGIIAVCGIDEFDEPKSRVDRSICFAFNLLQWVDEHSFPQLRVGIGYGDLGSAVFQVAKKRPTWDIWSNAINEASRMEKSAPTPMSVQLMVAAYRQITEVDLKACFEPFEHVDGIKGLAEGGALLTYATRQNLRFEETVQVCDKIRNAALSRAFLQRENQKELEEQQERRKLTGVE